MKPTGKPRGICMRAAKKSTEKDSVIRRNSDIIENYNYWDIKILHPCLGSRQDYLHYIQIY